ncbi:peptide/nickel transport system permease protein [Tistlia consotensis]|uniref:Peptide/nickel transport system permease protein n=1 Tax=Tistlia consotensis USBA 355 TaxID=560819 RepID=A0A1Y6CBB7_9PROT|nr:ABC transporter permease [Tistlia consotensis]SMF54453.1 peptide/nickel transport system permease protein [Tistlia consotensis USBA 355]SNR86973.1 peptide/nickel transport system permease protein [Tistlia consotensis]
MTATLPGDAPLDEPIALQRPTRRQRLRAVLGADRKAQVGLAVLAVFAVAGIFGALIAPYDPNAMAFDMLTAPSWAHPLGTDDLGRDLLSRIIVGTQVSLFVGVSTVGIALVVGVTLGLLAGYLGGWLDDIIMRYVDLQWAFPNIIIAVYLVAVFGNGLTNVIAAVSLAFVDDFARVSRSMVLSIREEQYVAAARTVGVSDFRIMWRHILPNATAPIIVQATVSVSYAILAEASLSFLGLGVESSTPTWGLILSDARSFVSRAWWLGIFPGLAIMLTVLSINFIGDALRDYFDVRETAG